ncbi:hypothetical protein FACS1894172_09670 [Spirochaetia bacterium]|nr:hypothetical protein FACS1894164_00620 [Spirochaetia bacterium]GHU32655.1 hypothetical protein FACS1894172_09670 [Spirochaetia bacterium]
MSAETLSSLIQKAYSSLKTLDATGARQILESALKLESNNNEVLYALDCLNWWLERIQRLNDIHDTYDKGGFILDQWKDFYTFLDTKQDHYDPCQYALRHFVFSFALQFLQGVLGDGINQYDPGLLLQVGRCYKGVGNYDLALKYLEQAVRFKREDAETIAELADVNALLEETRSAKALFREAFFMDPQEIPLRDLESEFIVRIQNKVSDMGYSGAEIAEWIPIYGTLFGVFSVKRELKSVEVGRLKQSILSLEEDIRSNPSDLKLLKPRLINRYFWLIDHYECIGESRGIIEEILLKIKTVDPAIFERYQN